jgi:hypothetical protein
MDVVLRILILGRGAYTGFVSGVGTRMGCRQTHLTCSVGRNSGCLYRQVYVCFEQWMGC